MPTPPLSPWTSLRLFFLRLARHKPPTVAIPSCYALLQVTVDPAKCDHCGNCSSVCPMNIDLLAYVDNEQRVGTPDCILCQTCVNACTQNALSVASTLDRPRKRTPR
jgi:ferredoxin